MAGSHSETKQAPKEDGVETRNTELTALSQTRYDMTYLACSLVGTGTGAGPGPRRLFRRRRRQQNRSASSAAKRARPPIVPPTMAPVRLYPGPDFCDVGGAAGVVLAVSAGAREDVGVPDELVVAELEEEEEEEEDCEELDEDAALVEEEEEDGLDNELADLVSAIEVCTRGKVGCPLAAVCTEVARSDAVPQPYWKKPPGNEFL